MVCQQGGVGSGAHRARLRGHHCSPQAMTAVWDCSCQPFAFLGDGGYIRLVDIKSDF